jgi:hypothetical protein
LSHTAKFKELNESARTCVANSLEKKQKAREASQVSLESASQSQQHGSPQLSPSSSRSERPSALESEHSSTTEQEEKKGSKFTELYFDICDILLEETADGEFVTLADLCTILQEVLWQRNNLSHQPIWFRKIACLGARQTRRKRPSGSSVRYILRPSRWRRTTLYR